MRKYNLFSAVMSCVLLASSLLIFSSCSVIHRSGENPAQLTAEIPEQFSVEQNTPNPFSSTTDISIAIPSSGHVTIEISTITGKKVATLLDKTMNAGNHTVTFDGTEHSTGIYFYTVTYGDFSKTMKMTLKK